MMVKSGFLAGGLLMLSLACSSKDPLVAVPEEDPCERLRCDDGNPCTEDRCDPNAGCVHLTASRDGTLCHDNNSCTTNDRCQNGVCAGDLTSGAAPQIIGMSGSVGAYGGAVVSLGEQRLLFVDHGFPSQQGLALTVTDITGDTLSVVRRNYFPQAKGLMGARAVSPNLVVGFEMSRRFQSYNTPVDAFRVYEVASDGSVTPRGTLGIFPERYPEFFKYVSGAHKYFMCKGEELFVLDVSDPDSPSEYVHTLPTYCRSVAFDESTQQILIATGDGVLLFGAGDPTALPPAGKFYHGTQTYDVKAKDGLAVVRKNLDPNAYLVDLSSTNEVGVVIADEEKVTDIFFGNMQRVVVLGENGDPELPNQIEIHSIANPAAPQLLGIYPVAGAEKPYLYGANDVHLLGDTLVAKRSNMSARAYALTYDASDTFFPMDLPPLGTLNAILPTLDGLATASFDSAQNINIDDPTAPTFVRNLGTDVYAMMTLSTPTGPQARLLPAYGSHFVNPSLLTKATGVGPWLDASDITATQHIGELWFAPETTAGRRVSTDGSTLLAVVEGSEGKVLELYDPFEAATVGALDPVEPVGTLEIIFSGTQTVADARIGADAERAVIARYDNTEVIPDSFLDVVNVADPTNPAPISEISTQGRVLSADVYRERVVAIIAEENAPFWWNQFFTGTQLQLWVEQGDGSWEQSSLSLENANHVLAFNGQTVFVSTLEGVTIVDVSGSEPTLYGMLELPQTPLHATEVNGLLATASNNVITLIEPGCPSWL